MIQDFSSVFVGKQAVKVRTVPVKGNAMAKKVIGGILAGALLTGLTASITFGLLIRSGMKELAAQNTVKLVMMKEQQGLYSQRNDLLDQEALSRAAGKLGLFVPESRQLRRL